MVIDIEIIEDIQIAYFIALLNIFQVWIYSEDNESDLRATRERQLMEINTILMTFFPNDGYGTISILPPKESGLIFPDNFFQTMKPYFEEVENKLIEAYNGFIQRFKCWIEPKPKDRLITFNIITGIQKNIYQHKNQFKFRFKIKALEGPLRLWIPVEYENHFKLKPAYERYLKNVIEREKYLLKNYSKNFNQYYINEKIFAIQCFQEELDEVDIPKYYDIDIIDKIETWKEEHHTDTRASFYFKWYPLTLSEAFPERTI